MLVSGAGVANCEDKGSVTVSVRDRVAGINRNTGKVGEELATLARNEAARMGGDTIVAAGPEQNGEQVYSVYRCRP